MPQATESRSILIRGGRLIDPASNTDRIADLAIRGTTIAAISSPSTKKSNKTGDFSPSDFDTVIDAEDLIIAPGLIDPHVHLREPGQEHKDTLATGSLAAVAGGFSTVCCMPNTSPALDSPELMAYIYDKASEVAQCRIFPVAAATKSRKGEELTEFRLLAKSGTVAFSDDGDCIASAGVMAKVLHACKDVNRAFMQHAQEPTMTKGASMHAGEISVKLGLVGWPRSAEELIVERDAHLNANISAHYHVQHISSGGTVEIMRRAQKAGTRITGEASPHHLTLTHDICDNYNALGKVNPPVRESSDMKALRQAVADGIITVLATDHAPHTVDEKSLPFEEAPFGFIGLETALPLYIESLIRTGAISWPRLIELLTVEPANLCGLTSAGLGRIQVDGLADITLIDPNTNWTVTLNDLKGNCTNTPYIGRKLQGRAVGTIVGGIVRHELLGKRVKAMQATGR